MNKKGLIGIGIAGILIVLIISALVGGFCWTYSINTVLHWLGKPMVVKFWQGALIGFVPFLGQVSLPIAVIVWILHLFI